jgi:anti-anti-sigma factor
MVGDASEFFRLEQTDGVLVVTALGAEISPEARDPLYAIGERLADAAEPRRMVLSLAGVKTLNSATIGVLINFQKRVRDAGGSLKICRLDPYVRNIFRLTKMDLLFDLHDTEQDAIAAFRVKARGPSPSWVSRFFGGK